MITTENIVRVKDPVFWNPTSQYKKQENNVCILARTKNARFFSSNNLLLSTLAKRTASPILRLHSLLRQVVSIRAWVC